MELFSCVYRVLQIDGDYAHLQQEDGENGPKLVARALLPENIREGSRLSYEMLQYELLEE